jgi:propanediol utilization protein
MQVERIVEEVMQALFVEMEASGRHVHLTKEQIIALFGHELTPERPLSQPGQYLAKERVCVVGPKGKFENVAVLGPARKEAQVEISLTDGRVLGIVPPIRPSGSVEGSPGAVIRGPLGEIRLDEGVIGAQRHIHMTPEAAKRMGVSDGQIVKLKAYTARPVIFEDVLIRVSKDFRTFAHLDHDEANACGFRKGDLGRILP